MDVSNEFKNRLSECLSRVSYWNGNKYAYGSQVILGPYKEADVDTPNGLIPIYTLRRTIINRPENKSRIIYEVIYLEVDKDTNEPQPTFINV